MWCSWTPIWNVVLVNMSRLSSSWVSGLKLIGLHGVVGTWEVFEDQLEAVALVWMVGQDFLVKAACRMGVEVGSKVGTLMLVL